VGVQVPLPAPYISNRCVFSLAEAGKRIFFAEYTNEKKWGVPMYYGLHDKPPWGVTLLSALQWLIVTVSSSVVVPLIVGDVYGLQPGEISRFMQQTLFFVGLASFLQVWIGHRYPMMEAPAGLWWGIFIILAQIGLSVGVQPRLIGQSLQLGLLVAGILFAGLGIAGWIGKIQQWFTPLVSGTYMVLLAISLCSNFVSRMLGIGYQQAVNVQAGISLVSLGIVAIVIMLMRIPKLASFAVLLGMAIGWGAYALLGWTQPISHTEEVIVLPTLFFWGPLRWDGGVVLTSVLTGFVLLTNLITSTVVVGRATGQPATVREYNRGGIFTGVSHMLSGMAGVVGMIPLSLAAAVIQTTRMAARLPFMVAMLSMMLIGMLPGVSQFLAAMPTPVAYAAMFVSFTQLLGFGLKDLASARLDERAITIVGSSLLLGIGVMFVPAAAWKQLHPLLSFLFGNGLLLGVLVCLLMEHVVFRRPRTTMEKDGSL
jgi:xanthine/uracil permease